MCADRMASSMGYTAHEKEKDRGLPSVSVRANICAICNLQLLKGACWYTGMRHLCKFSVAPHLMPWGFDSPHTLFTAKILLIIYMKVGRKLKEAFWCCGGLRTRKFVHEVIFWSAFDTFHVYTHKYASVWALPLSQAGLLNIDFCDNSRLRQVMARFKNSTLKLAM